MINVNWDDAKAYTAWLSRKTGYTYRLSPPERSGVGICGACGDDGGALLGRERGRRLRLRERPRPDELER